MKISHVVCAVEAGENRADTIKRLAVLAEIAGVEVHAAFNGEVIVALPSLDRPPTVMESLAEMIRRN
jgi:hypothetical protein